MPLNTFIVRQKLLQILNRDLRGAPAEAAFIVQGVPGAELPAAREQIAAELLYLVQEGFAEDAMKTLGLDPQYRITPAGARQISRQEQLDPRIWGAQAV